jgi:transcriptional regulator with XRE-family HTH domain
MGQEAQRDRHQGHIVAEYRKRRHWTQETLAEALKLDKRTVQRIEQRATITSVEQRELLVGLLGIPVELMGLERKPRHEERAERRMNADRMHFYEEELTTRWEMFHYSGTTRAARGLDTWTQEIAHLATNSRGTPWQVRAYALLAMSYQLQISTYRDKLAFEEAHTAYRCALKIGRSLDNPELIAAAMAREGLALLQEDRAEDAVTCLRQALECIKQMGLPHLKGYILQALSEAYAKAQEAKLSWQSISLAERALEHAGSTFELSQAKISLTTITAQKGVNAVLLQDNERAIALIDRSLAQYDPTMVRARSRLTAQKAEAYYHLGQIKACVATAEDALTLARSVGSSKTIARLKKLQRGLAHSRASAEPQVARLGALLALQ